MTFHQGCGWAWPSSASGPLGWTRCSSSQRPTRPGGPEPSPGVSTTAGMAYSRFGLASICPSLPRQDPGRTTGYCTDLGQEPYLAPTPPRRADFSAGCQLAAVISAGCGKELFD